MATSAPVPQSAGLHQLAGLSTWKRLSIGLLLALGLYRLAPDAWPTLLRLLTAWPLVHILFTLRYVHLFYNTDAGRREGGLEFIGNDTKADYLNFTYFSYTIGMAAQTANGGISDHRIGRVVLVHRLLSFGFNTAVVALTISGLAGLL